MKIHEKIRNLREMNHWTQEDMAEKLSLSVAGYAKIENGKTHLTLKRLEQFAEIFNVEILDLIQNENNVFYQLNPDSNARNQAQVFYNIGSQSNTEERDLVNEIEKLKLVVEHKNELINQLQQQIYDLRTLNKLLQSNNP